MVLGKLILKHCPTNRVDGVLIIFCWKPTVICRKQFRVTLLTALCQIEPFKCFVQFLKFLLFMIFFFLNAHSLQLTVCGTASGQPFLRCAIKSLFIFLHSNFSLLRLLFDMESSSADIENNIFTNSKSDIGYKTAMLKKVFNSIFSVHEFGDLR